MSFIVFFIPQIHGDPVGYGFVIRGSSPTYVQAVDPMGPAIRAGLKVRIFSLSNWVNKSYDIRVNVFDFVFIFN